MKKLLSLIFLIFLLSRTYGQLTVNAGNDTAICSYVGGSDTIEIGGNPTAFGGVEPYIYTWSTHYSVGSLLFGASHFLDDSTKSNPKIVNPTYDFIKLKLTVTDNLGTKAEDSITIRFSVFYHLAIECIDFINQGDTVTLSGNMGNGIGPLSYVWSPNYNISDITAASPNVWPDTTVYYKVYAIDSIGCRSEPSTCFIYVNTSGISQIINDMVKSEVLPNPIKSNSKILLSEDIVGNATIQVFNAYGQTILLDKISSDTYIIGEKINSDGLYIYMIKIGNTIVSHGKFVK